MKEIPHYCQRCGASNQLGEQNCQKCGTRLMLVVFPAAIRHDDAIAPSFYEDHLLERVTLLEIRLSQVADRLSLALDIMLRQSRNTHLDHLLLETLIESLNTLGAVEKASLKKNWRKKVKNRNNAEVVESKAERLLRETSVQVDDSKKDLFIRLMNDSLQLLGNREDRQALRNLDRALAMAPHNVPLLLFIAETNFQTQNYEKTQSYLDRILQIDPGNWKAKLLLGIVLADVLELRRAKKILTKSLNKKECIFIINYVLGIIFAYEKDWKSALERFKNALNASESPETNYLVACVYFQLNKFKLAIRHLQKTVEADTNFADAWFMLAVIYKIIGDETKSYQSIELAWSSKEVGADCLKFMKRGSQIEIDTALPFCRLKDFKKHLIMNSSARFDKLIRGEVIRLLNE